MSQHLWDYLDVPIFMELFEYSIFMELILLSPFNILIIIDFLNIYNLTCTKYIRN